MDASACKEACKRRLFLSQSHRRRGHVGAGFLAERGLILELELLRHRRRVAELILHAAVKLQRLRRWLWASCSELSALVIPV